MKKDKVVRRVRMLEKLRMRIDKARVRVQIDVLPVPIPDPGIGPDLRANAIELYVAPRFESRVPIFRPLFIDVLCSTLPGNRRGEEHTWSSSNQKVDKGVSRGAGQVFRNFQTYRQIEPAGGVYPPDEIA